MALSSKLLMLLGESPSFDDNQLSDFSSVRERTLCDFYEDIENRSAKASTYTNTICTQDRQRDVQNGRYPNHYGSRVHASRIKLFSDVSVCDISTHAT